MAAAKKAQESLPLVVATFVVGHDWQAMYINDEIMHQGHKCSERHWQMAVNDHHATDISLIYLNSNGLDWLWKKYPSKLPERLSEIPNEYMQ